MPLLKFSVQGPGDWGNSRVEYKDKDSSYRVCVCIMYTPKEQSHAQFCCDCMGEFIDKWTMKIGNRKKFASRTHMYICEDRTGHPN